MTIKFKVINGVKHYYGEVNGLCVPLTSQQLDAVKKSTMNTGEQTT